MSFKVTNQHWEIIVNFMELHPDFARNRINGPTGRETMKRLWDELSNQLNSVGLGERSNQKWQKTWTDYKYILKRKASDLKNDISGTGGGPPKGSLLTELDERILSILGKSFYNGLEMPENGLHFLKKSDTSIPKQSKTFEEGIISAKIVSENSQHVSNIQLIEEKENISADLDKIEQEQKENKKTPNSNKRILTDHDYIKTPLKKQPRRVTPEDNMENMCKETLDELRDIKYILKDLGKTAQGIETCLINLCEILKQKK